MKGGVWYTGTEARTSWIDATIYPNPVATKFDSTENGTFPVIVGQDGLGQTTLFEHEVGTDQVNPDGSTTTVTSFIQSYDFDLQQRQRSATGQATGPTVAGEVFLAVRRFVPDFKDLQGNAKVTMGVKRYPQQNTTTTALSPFTITASTDKKDTRARGRFVNIKIENDKIHSFFTLDGEVSLKEFDFKKGDFFTVSKVENIMITAQKSSKLFEISSPIKPSYKTYSN